MSKAPQPALTVVTLGVRSVAESGRFYERLGFQRKMRATGDEIVFLAAGGVALALWDRDKLRADAGFDAALDTAFDIALDADPARAARPGPPRFGGVTLAWNCASPQAVDAAFARAVAAGGNRLREPEPTDYGGYRGYFSDPDGHVWEIVQAPGFTLTDEGRLLLPE